jgi:signal peptidase I
MAILGSNPRNTLMRIAALVVGAFVVFGLVLQPVRLQGISMLPTYPDGGINFANRYAYVFHPPQRFDIIAIRMAGPSVLYVKRVVGLPGERIAIVDGTVMINGAPLAEPTVLYRIPWNMEPMTLDADEYFVVGDNRSMRMDEHDFGRASRNRIVGKLLF